MSAEDNSTDNSLKLDRLRIDRSQSRSKPLLRSPLLWLLLTALAGGAGFMLFVFAGPGASPALEVRVQAARIEGGTAAGASVLDASGYVVARRMATVSAEVTGKVIEVHVEEGMKVKQGDLLARLEDDIAQARFDLARSRLDAGQSAMREIEVNIRQALRDLERSTALVERGLVSDSQHDQTRLTLEALQARRERTREDIQVAQRELELQQRYLGDMNIRAPFDGVVVAKTAQPGEIISPVSAGGGFTRTGICTIVDMSSLEVEVDVNEAYINRVAAGQPVEVTLNAWPNDPYRAQTIAIVPTADRSKATVRVRIGFVDRDERVLPDMGVKVAFLEESVAARPSAEVPRVTIPASALVREADGDYAGDSVFVYQNGAVLRREVRIGEVRGARIQVLSGVEAGERVVVSPSQALKAAGADGREVRVELVEAT